ncbi:MAG TPA: glycosyltransferase, partial [Verrucomicrobiae bacterium]|nr:glycosyltransferase [Verrucomicrobiae bacterium]
IMGRANGLDLSGTGMEIQQFGFVQNERFKAQVFSAADVFAFPTRADNLPLILQESMACGTPMVSFNVGGVPDLVRPEVTGMLAPPEDARTFGILIERILATADLRQRMSHECREIANREYSLTLQAQRYRNIFQGLLDVSKNV